MLQVRNIAGLGVSTIVMIAGAAILYAAWL